MLYLFHIFNVVHPCIIKCFEVLLQQRLWRLGMDQKLKQEFREILRRFYQVGNMKHIYQLQCNSALVDVIKGFWYKV